MHPARYGGNGIEAFKEVGAVLFDGGIDALDEGSGDVIFCIDVDNLQPARYGATDDGNTGGFGVVELCGHLIAGKQALLVGFPWQDGPFVGIGSNYRDAVGQVILCSLV